MSQESNKKPGFIGRTFNKARDAGASALRGLADRLEPPKATFEIAEIKIDFGVDVDADTLWATLPQIAELFGRNSDTVGEHLANAYAEGEISREATTGDFPVVRMEGGRTVSRTMTHYNLDAILEVGRRVRSPHASQFRKWANQILKNYIVHGYALDDQRLRNDPAAAASADEQIRSIRYDEKNLYERIRACIAIIASDYDGSSEQVRSFFAELQNKFHFVACGNTAHDILLTRADSNKAMMGMSTHLGNKLTLKDATVAKNYLTQDELRAEYRAGDAFFIFAEQVAASGRTMTTAQILKKIDEIFRSYEMPIFTGYKGPYKGELAKSHVRREYDLFRARSAQERYQDGRQLPPS